MEWDPNAVAAMYVAAFQLIELRYEAFKFIELRHEAKKHRRRCGQCADCTARCHDCVACFRPIRKQGCKRRPACRRGSEAPNARGSLAPT
jgi:hypothetical protein